MVKYSRVQSAEQPMRRICSVIVPPDTLFHAHTFSKKPARPKSWRDTPSSANWRSTTIWVAMPAWSVPGIQAVLQPFMR